MSYVKLLLVFVLGWVLLLVTPPLPSIAWANGIAQLLLFIPVVCIPVWRTGRISYVDINWPWGLVLIGVLVLGTWREGHIDTELPRYKFQQRRWEKAGIRNLPLIRQVEVLVQAMANASFLAFAVPCCIAAEDVTARTTLLETFLIIN